MYSFIHNLLTSSSIICHQCFRIIENRLQILVGRYLLRFQVYPLFVVVVLGGGYCPSIIKNIYCWPLFSIDYCHYWLSIIKNPTIKNRRQLIIELLFSIVITNHKGISDTKTKKNHLKNHLIEFYILNFLRLLSTTEFPWLWWWKS